MTCSLDENLDLCDHHNTMNHMIAMWNVFQNWQSTFKRLEFLVNFETIFIVSWHWNLKFLYLKSFQIGGFSWKCKKGFTNTKKTDKKSKNRFVCLVIKLLALCFILFMSQILFNFFDDDDDPLPEFRPFTAKKRSSTISCKKS